MKTRAELHWGRLFRCYAERPASIDAMFRAAVVRAPDREAVVDGAIRMTYAELDRSVDALAGGLSRRGVSVGDRVAVMLPNCLEAVICVLAIARLGAAIVPIGTRLRRPEIMHILDDAQPAALVYAESFESQIPGDAKWPNIAMRFCVGRTATQAQAFDELAAQDPFALTVSIPEEELYGILYTSGTTGRPKGATLTHLGAVHSCLHWVDALALPDGGKTMLCIPWSHVAGLCGVLLPFLHVNGCLVLMREFDKRLFLQNAERERIDHALLVPAMYGLCLLDPDFERFDLARWKLGVYGSAPMPEATIRRFAQALPHLVMCNAYGATETTSPATIMPPGMGVTHSDSIGKVVRCGEIHVMNEDGVEVEPGEQGELWIGGPMVVTGYWRNPDADVEAFKAGYWKSGDIGSIDRDGFVRIADRKKDMINRGGFKVYPAEVENVLCEHAEVVEAAVVGRADEILGERVVAFVHCKHPLTEDAVRQFCVSRLADYKVPDYVIVGVDAPLPRNANGKIQKQELRERAAQLPERRRRAS